MGDTTTSTLALFDQLLAPPRPRLCTIVGSHDRTGDGTCRDCGKTLDATDAVSATCLLHELPGARTHVTPERIGFRRHVR